MKINILKKLVIFSFAITALVLPNVSFADTTPPYLLMGSPRDNAAFIQWYNSGDISNHLVEYKQTSAGNWTTFVHPISSNRGILVNNLVNGTSYDFRVSAISSEGTSAPSSIISVTPAAGTNFSSNNQIILTGQSLASGYNSLPALTTSQPYSNKMFDVSGSSFVPLTETAAGGYFGAETMSSAMANKITSLASGTVNYSSIVGIKAQNGAAYVEVKQGTTVYNDALASITQAKLLSIVMNNKTLIVPAINVLHGEADEVYNTPADQYEADLVEWQNDYETDIKTITGQAEPVKLFTDQVSSWGRFNHVAPNIALAQYNAAKNNPDNIVLVAPKYMLDYLDGYHLLNYSTRRLGEYYGKVYKKVIIDGEQWKPLMPTSITMNGNVIQATFHVPVAPLAFDTTAILEQTNYGFEYADSTNSASITNVQILDADTVQITLSQIPTGSNPRLRYAYTAIPGYGSGSHDPHAPRGNLRDSDTTPALQDANTPAYFGGYLRNWAVTFDEPITTAPTIPNTPTNVVATLGGSQGSAVVSFAPVTDNGTGPIIHYRVTSTPGNIVMTTSGSPVTIIGLANNTTYTFTVKAQTATGWSLPSAPSNPVTPHWNMSVKPSVIGPVVQSSKPAAKPNSMTATVLSPVIKTKSLTASAINSTEAKIPEVKKEETRVETKPIETKKIETKETSESKPRIEEIKGAETTTVTAESATIE